MHIRSSETGRVLRQHACMHACAQGPVLRSIQRFGRLGKRSGNVPPEAKHSKDKIKEAKYMYLSIDEAGTHVNVRRFRCAPLSTRFTPC